MSEVENQFIRTGIWTDWSKGATMGRTLTVDSRTGNLIIALLSILASIATGQLWNLFAFLYHQFRAKSVLSDGLFWQQQILLRTLPTPTAMMADITKLWWTWRKKADRPHLRSSIPLLFALCFSVTAVVAGIFTSYVVTTTNIEVLVNSPACRFIPPNQPEASMNEYYSDCTVKLKPVLQSSVRDCYRNSSSLPTSCRSTFVNPNVSLKVDPAPCPWDSSMCSEGDTPAITMDSGLLDMSHFGLNVNRGDNVKFRKKTTCNVLPRDGYSIVRNITYWAERMAGSRNPLPQEEGIAYRYGSGNPTASNVHPEDTFVHSLAAGNITIGYTTQSTRSYLDRSRLWNQLSPLAEMNNSNADLTLIVVYTNQAYYMEPIEDPLFSAHQTYKHSVASGQEFVFYYADSPGGVVGCTMQYQFCISRQSDKDICSSLTALPSNFSREEYPGATDTQLAILQLLWVASMIHDIGNAPNQEVLQASELITTSQVPTLPDDQWVQEVVGWESFAWAGIQTTLLDFIVGPSTRVPGAESYLSLPTSAGEKNECRLMKVRKPGGFANINVFGLAFIATFCVVITLFNMTVLRFFIFLSKSRQTLGPRIDRWSQDGIFQLTRRAFDAHGEGTWVDLEKEIPSTSGKELLGQLPTESLPVPTAPYTVPVAPSIKSSVNQQTTTHASSASTLDVADVQSVHSIQSAQSGLGVARISTTPGPGTSNTILRQSIELSHLEPSDTPGHK